MPDALRVYDPAECDERGVPLDWERCRRCDGRGHREGYESEARYCGRPGCCVCGVCHGHGSLKAAALDWLTKRRQPESTFTGRDPLRCEDCGHPMSEGNDLAHAERCLRMGVEPQGTIGRGVFYSPCDEGCRHGGPVRCPDGGTCHHECADFQPGGYPQGECWRTFNAEPLSAYGEQWPRPQPKREASWRPVDVRTLGWPHDLRPEKLAVLCLRCWADRVPSIGQKCASSGSPTG
jgi:hypothetical protein